MIRDTWSSRDIALVEHVDGVAGLPDRQLVMILAGIAQALAQDESNELMERLFPGEVK